MILTLTRAHNYYIHDGRFQGKEGTCPGWGANVRRRKLTARDPIIRATAGTIRHRDHSSRFVDDDDDEV